MPHVPAAQFALRCAESLVGPDLSIRCSDPTIYVIALLTVAQAKIALIVGANDGIDIWNAVIPRFGKLANLA